MKVVHQLGVAGYIETVRGRGGGLRLAKPVETIGLAEVIRITEPDMAIVSCFKPVNTPCMINPSCVLKRALERAQDAFMEVLQGYTLADLVAPRARLAGLLGILPDGAAQSQESAKKA
jgi:Rrf2 family nitric oxide-sensitive transcriptional repressor